LHDVRNAAAIGGTINYPQLIINKAALGTSEYKNTNCNPSGCNGGAIAVRSLEKVDIQIASTSFTNNRAGANGAAIFVEGSINNKALTVSLTSSTFTNNVAVTSASILYAPSTASSSSLTIADSDFTTNQATLGDGGLFYMSAVTSNSIVFNNALVVGAGINSIINTASSGGNGGVFYFNG
jgi:predicted outer membrane repeat protein